MIFLTGLVLASGWSVPAAAQSAQEQRERMYTALNQEADLIERQTGLLRKVVKVVQPSVVHIQANKTSRSKNNALTRVEEAGAGVIMKYVDRFYVVTNRHVIMDARNRDIRIQLEDGRFFNPVEVRTDPDSDLAVLFLQENDLAAARFGDSDRVEIGDFVVAVGSPFGLSHSVSYGIISARGRRDLELGSEGVRFQDFLQTDAAINPGNSGGPLMNLRGEVIGINTAIASNSGGNDGIGFSIPVNMVSKVVQDLLRFGHVRRGFVGVSLDRRFSPEKARALGLNSVFGARVSQIAPNSPAADSDLQLGDIILDFNGERIVNDSHLVSEVSQTEIGSVVPMTVYRNGSRRKLSIMVRERSATLQASSRESQ
jgi:serine protease Do